MADPITLGLAAVAAYFGYKYYKNRVYHWLFQSPDAPPGNMFYALSGAAPVGARGLAKSGDFITTSVLYTSASADETNKVSNETHYQMHVNPDKPVLYQVLWQVVEPGPVTYKVKYVKILNVDSNFDKANPPDAKAEADLKGTVQVPMKYVGTIIAQASLSADALKDTFVFGGK
jgi:hypothetical protein